MKCLVCNDSLIADPDNQIVISSSLKTYNTIHFYCNKDYRYNNNPAASPTQSHYSIYFDKSSHLSILREYLSFFPYYVTRDYSMNESRIYTFYNENYKYITSFSSILDLPDNPQEALNKLKTISIFS